MFNEELRRYFDRFITRDSAPQQSVIARTRHPAHVITSMTVRVQLWDGDSPIMPIIVLKDVPGDICVYPPKPLDADLVPNATAAVTGCSSLLENVCAHPSYAVMRAASTTTSPQSSKYGPAEPPGWNMRADDKLHFFCMGALVARENDTLHLSTLLGVGWTECTLDLSLNRAADKHLATRKYDISYTFSVRVDAVELARPASEEAPFGLAPSTYVSVEHGRTVRFSHVELDTRAPNFEWVSGSIIFEPHEPLKLRVFMAKRHEVNPQVDKLIGQLWIEAPVLPLPRDLAHPRTSALSLGTNVGVVHISVRGPAIRRRIVEGCFIRCGNCILPICGVPPCLPSCSVTLSRGLKSFVHGVTGELCGKIAAAFCCCVTLGAIVASSSPRSAAKVLEMTTSRISRP